MTVTERTMTVRQGVDTIEVVYVEDADSGGFLNVTDDTITLTVNDSSGTEALSLTTTAEDISVINGPGGHIEITYSSSDVTGLTAANDYWRYLEVVHDGETRIVMDGKLVVRPAI